MLTLVLAGLLGFICVVVVAWPLLRIRDSIKSSDRFGKSDYQKLRLLEERDRALVSLKELDIDYGEGKITDEDYQVLRNVMRGEVADALKAIDIAKKSGDPFDN